MKKSTIEITSPDKILYPKEKIKKLDVINYYLEVSWLMLPYVSNRIISAIRCHEGIDGEIFFKKHPTTDKKVETIKYKGEDYFYIKDQIQLLYQVQMGTLEFHTWGSRVKSLNKPDIMVFDLDPDEKLPLNKLREAVLKVKSILDELDLTSFLKISGGKGYHIVVPFNKTKDWDSFYGFSKNLSLIAESRWKNQFTTNVRKLERKGKIFVDYLRNNIGATCVAPFSLRAREGATISMPISWEDLNKIKPNEVNIKNYKKYLNDSWNDFFKVKQELLKK